MSRVVTLIVEGNFRREEGGGTRGWTGGCQREKVNLLGPGGMLFFGGEASKNKGEGGSFWDHGLWKRKGNWDVKKRGVGGGREPKSIHVNIETSLENYCSR